MTCRRKKATGVIEMGSKAVRAVAGAAHAHARAPACASASLPPPPPVSVSCPADDIWPTFRLWSSLYTCLLERVAVCLWTRRGGRALFSAAVGASVSAAGTDFAER